MNIAIVCPNFPPASFEGGIAHYSRLLAKYLKLNGHKICAITSTEYSIPVEGTEKSESIEIIFVKGPWNHNTVKNIQKIVSKRKIDVLILQYSPASFHRTFRLKWAISNFTCQKITAFHTLWGNKIDCIFGLLCLVGSHKIIATNSEIMMILKKRFPFLLNKTYCIPIASNITPDYSHVCKQQKNRPIITYFGMLYPGKGLDLILNVLELLRSRNQNFDFKFIGGGMLDHGSYEREFRAKIIEKRLGQNAEHLGLIPENKVSEWLKKSRFVFLPYERGLSDRRGSFMAAIAHGKAVLTSPPAVEMPFLKNGYNVIWPEKAAVTNYLQIIEQLLVNDKLICRLEKEALKLSQRFSWEKIATAYQSALMA